VSCVAGYTSDHRSEEPPLGTIAAVERVDAIVIGAGVAGGAAARSFGRRGLSCVLLEQFQVGHARGSSHGPSRLFRLAYPQEDYVRLALRAVDSWRELEDAAGEQLLVITGGLYAGTWAESCSEALLACGLGARQRWLSGDEAGERFPAMSFAGLPRLLWQEDGGVCLAERTVAAQVRVARQAGVDVREDVEALRLRESSAGVEVETHAGALLAGVCVVTAGPYARPLLDSAGASLPLQPAFAQVSYYASTAPVAAQLPGFVEADLNSGRLATGGYWVPAVDGTSVVKAGDGAPGRDVDAREAPFAVDPEEEGWVSELIKRRLPGFDPVPTRSETCIYTMTPDQDFVLDRRGALVVGSACSGHGFKFGPLLGELLADLATQADPAPHARFALARFVR
jgi:sarcosine oxidase